MVPNHDPQPYDGPIERADGERPFNMYLYETETWAPGHRVPGLNIAYQFRIGIVALADGRWSTSGFVYHIQRGSDDLGPVVFDSREAAIRASAARFFQALRWHRKFCDRQAERSIMRRAAEYGWSVLVQEVGHPPDRTPVGYWDVEPPPALPRGSGLPLFDRVAAHA